MRKLNHYEKIVFFEEVRSQTDQSKIIQAILDRLGLCIVEEATPDYVAYDVLPVE